VQALNRVMDAIVIIANKSFLAFIKWFFGF